MLRPIVAALLAAALPCATLADDDGPNFGLDEIPSASNKAGPEPISCSAGLPLTQAPWDPKFGTYYEFEIIGDGSQKLPLVSPRVFRALRIGEIVVEGLDIRPLDLDQAAYL